MENDKITSFYEWCIAITAVLEINQKHPFIDEFIDGKHYKISIGKFFDVCNNHQGWQDTLMKIGDYFCGMYLFTNGLNYTRDDVIQTRKFVIDYFEDFTINAIKAGYDDYKKDICK